MQKAKLVPLYNLKKRKRREAEDIQRPNLSRSNNDIQIYGGEMGEKEKHGWITMKGGARRIF